MTNEKNTATAARAPAGWDAEDSDDSPGTATAAADIGFNLLLFVMLLLSKASLSPVPEAVSVKLPEIDSAPQSSAGSGSRSVTFEIAPDGRVTLASEPGKVLTFNEAAAQAGPGVPVAIAVDKAAPAVALIQLESSLSKNGTTSISITALAHKETR